MAVISVLQVILTFTEVADPVSKGWLEPLEETILFSIQVKPLFLSSKTENITLYYKNCSTNKLL